MFNGASEFKQQMCGWTFQEDIIFFWGKDNMFDGSLCSVESCLECTELS